jgi:hypothetical protein
MVPWDHGHCEWLRDLQELQAQTNKVTSGTSISIPNGTAMRCSKTPNASC